MLTPGIEIDVLLADCHITTYNKTTSGLLVRVEAEMNGKFSNTSCLRERKLGTT